jgi:hypothetical protein
MGCLPFSWTLIIGTISTANAANDAIREHVIIFVVPFAGWAAS